MNTIGMTALLKTKTARVYADFVPDGKTLPAVAYTHVSDGFTRVLKGEKSGLWDSWRILIVGNDRAESETLQNLLKELDNTSSVDFKNIFVIAAGNLSAAPEDQTRTAYVDIKTYG